MTARYISLSLTYATVANNCTFQARLVADHGNDGYLHGKGLLWTDDGWVGMIASAVVCHLQLCPGIGR
jgi:hypothetical protein